MDDLLTVEDTAKVLGVSVSRVRQLLGEDRFRFAFKRGGAWWIPKQSVELFKYSDRDRRRKKKPRTEVPGNQVTMDM